LISQLLGGALTTEFQDASNPEAKQAEDLIKERLKTTDKSYEMVVVRSATLTVDDPEYKSHVDKLFAGLMGLGDAVVEGAATYYMTGDKTLVSPEILARGGAGESRTVRRCFDPPDGWRFDKEHRRILVVERLGWLGDIPDVTQNSGTVEFADDEEPAQICVVATARPASKEARAATIGRFEVTLVRDAVEERTTKSGVRALDWRESVRVPIAPGMTDWKLYLRLFDEIDRDSEGTLPKSVPFLQVTLEGEGDSRAIVLRADPAAEP